MNVSGGTPVRGGCAGIHPDDFTTDELLSGVERDLLSGDGFYTPPACRGSPGGTARSRTPPSQSRSGGSSSRPRSEEARARRRESDRLSRRAKRQLQAHREAEARRKAALEAGVPRLGERALQRGAARAAGAGGEPDGSAQLLL